jgi:hypothetical protein
MNNKMLKENAIESSNRASETITAFSSAVASAWMITAVLHHPDKKA